MLNVRVPLYAVVLAMGAGVGGALLFMSHAKNQAKPVVTVMAPSNCDYAIRRVSGYGHISPLLSAEPVCESSRYSATKAAIIGLIDEEKRKGTVTDVGVYVRDFARGDWFAVNGDMRFDPGSMLKVPIMLTMLKMAEENSSLFNTPWTLTAVPPMPKPSFPASSTIELGKPYVLPTLLEYSIQRSDNLANALLIQHLDQKEFQEMLIQLGLPDIEGDVRKYPLSPKDCAQFFKSIYNATFLSPRTADFAMNELLRADFDQGLKAGLPKGIEIAHKFGESGDEGARQLHESGIVFANGRPYLVVVMTRGTAMDPLPEVLASVSRKVYEGMTGSN